MGRVLRTAAPWKMMIAKNGVEGALLYHRREKPRHYGRSWALLCKSPHEGLGRRLGLKGTLRNLLTVRRALALFPHGAFSTVAEQEAFSARARPQ